jgi:hypothetical protein
MRGDEQSFTFNGIANTTVSQDLYADGYTINSDAYIVTCVGTQFGGVCTTGNPEYDKIIFNADNTKIFPYTVTIEGGSKKQISLGKLKAKATVTTQGLAGGLAFYGVTIGDDNLLVGKGPAQKLAVAPFADQVTTKCVAISWNTVIPTPTPVPVVENSGGGEQPWWRVGCPRCRWDPYGIVFDSQSLEPLPGVQVTILDKNKNKYYLPGLTNPQTTLADGLFNFLVEPGVYYLTTSGLGNHNFTENPNLHPNYIKIYHKADGSNSIYKPDEQIAEIIDTEEEMQAGKPNMEHRDIPLDPGANKPFEGQPSTIAYKIAREGIITKVDGKVSHPYTDVTFSQNGNLIVKVKTDRYGFYKTEFNNSDLDQDQDISVLYTKADLKTVDIIEMASILKPEINNSLNKFFDDLASGVLSRLSKEAMAQSTIKITSSNEAFKISPIFPYIEGYAYDQNNRVAAGATINLKLKMNNTTIYETKADNNGYFKIDSKHVPIFPYYLEIVAKSGGSPVIFSSSEFAKKNKDYLTNNKINLVEGTKDNKPIITGDQTSSAPEVSNTDRSNVGSQEKKTVSASQSKISSMLILILVIFVFLILIGATIFFIIKNKNNQSFTGQNF